MNILYIDANIYLKFYNSNILEYKKLLRSVIRDYEHKTNTYYK
jgi:hypothetical protein